MNTLILLALTLGATLPDVTIDNTKLLWDEADWLSRARVRHYVDQQAKIDAFAATTTAVNAEVEALTAEAAALPDGAEKTALLQQITTIEAGQTERGKIFAKGIRRAVVPTPAKARKRTMENAYNGTVVNPAVDTNGNGTLSRGETGWPVWLFTLVDTDASGQATAAEFGAYVATL